MNTAQNLYNETNRDLSVSATEMARRLDDAQRAVNHLSALVETWDEHTDGQRYESVIAALIRLTRQAG